MMIVTLSLPGKAWVYPEHRDIALLAIRQLDSAHRAALDNLWLLARKGFEQRLDASVADISQGEHPHSLDYAAWPAIAGDHSTSPDDMLHNILQTRWILEVADVAARLKNGLANVKTRSDRVNQLRDSDLRLLRVDPDYVTRAGSNNVHFMIARPDVNTSAETYFDECCREGAEPNLVGTYKWFHTSALVKAGRLSTEHLSPDQRSALIISMLADEAFALHFLEDGFAAGHVAGIWGNAALRKGTHDNYDEHGLEITTWKGERLVLTGDAYMRDVDGSRAANSVMMSLVQLLDMTSGKKTPSRFNDQPGVFTPDTFNIARAVKMPFRSTDPAINEMISGVLLTTPVPGLATGLGEIPRFRSELGPFLGIAPAARVSGISGGFGTYQQTAGLVPGLEFALHIGLGMDGVLNESGDGLVFLDLGWRLDGASSVKVQHDPLYNQFGSILSAIPTREAFFFRFRMPFYLVPGDLLIAGPVLLLASPQNLNKMVAKAGQGGLIPWQSGMGTPVGRFQFILGREIGVCFYGSLQGADSFIMADETKDPEALILFSMPTTHLDFPILEYRPMRTFSRRQSASIVLQLNAGLDIPGKVHIISPLDAGPVHVRTTWFIGLRLAFDWRYYYARKKT